MRRLTVWISAAAWKRLATESTRRRPLETGGVLMGYTSNDRDTIVITNVIGPGPRAIHGRTTFAPDPAYQERAIARRYRESQRRITYLGDWHSHPGGTARLSRTDRKTLRRIRDHADARTPEPVMTVLHGRDEWHVTVWRLQRRRGRSGSTLRKGKVGIY